MTRRNRAQYGHEWYKHAHFTTHYRSSSLPLISTSSSSLSKAPTPVAIFFPLAASASKASRPPSPSGNAASAAFLAFNAACFLLIFSLTLIVFLAVSGISPVHLDTLAVMIMVSNISRWN